MTMPPRPEVPDAHGAPLQEARQAVLDAVDLMDNAEVAALLGVGDLGGVVGLLGLPLGEVVRYPTFQFDVTAKTLRPVVRAVNELLDPKGTDGWAVASWWVRSDARLYGASPVSLLGTEEEPHLFVMAQGDIEGF
ncbi:hypothetical protein [Georgenia ruanii]|uniref:hypothetical protein n=1 Tax=Georgenia ruanii TaxID=348442 RepID=UPI001264705E|nr:hypothetical protein [Georgenia ruanii]